MGVSARHTRRMLAAYREKGAAALAHGNRGRRPANATPNALASEAVRLARSRYAGVNHTHLSELLREREGIDIVSLCSINVRVSGQHKCPQLGS